MVKKIIISGFPHCGTTILKSIIGHIDEVHEIYEETDKINLNNCNKKFIVCKYPKYNPKFLSEQYNDYIKIFIIRNPLYVFSSLNRRFDINYHSVHTYHSIEEYIEYVSVFSELVSNKKKNVYTIKYEDMFKNDFLHLKNIFNNIGMKYDNCIFDNTKYINYCDKKKTHVKEKDVKGEMGKSHKDYRIMQINKPFVSNNHISKITITKRQLNKIINNINILKLYPGILNFISQHNTNIKLNMWN